MRLLLAHLAALSANTPANPSPCSHWRPSCQHGPAALHQLHAHSSAWASCSSFSVKVGVKNFLVVGLDQVTERFLAHRGVPCYLRPLRSRSGSTDNHATSGLKFQILYEMLSVGASVLLSDVDIVITQNPFLGLYRDSDVEAMSDGWDERTAYGYVHTLPLPADDSVLRSLRLVARNSGLFYLSATRECLRLMRILAKRMATEDVWDQSAFNVEIFRPAYGNSLTAGASVKQCLHASRTCQDCVADPEGLVAVY